MNKQSKKKNTRLIASNKKARHDYELLEQFEAGLVLEGWEVKSLREGRANLKESYVIIKRGEAWLIGTHISPLPTASTHINPVADRTRKLLLNTKELNKLIGAIQQKGLTVVALDLHWSRHFAKVKIALAKGKQTHDKRQSAKDRDWQREKQRLMSHK